MQYSVVILALAGTALAQLPGVPSCANPILAPAIASCGSSPDGLIACLCSEAPSFSAPIVSACPCTDVNSALGAAKGFCTGLSFTPLNCDAKTTSTLATSTPASTTPIAVSSTSTPAAGSTSSSVAASTGSASSSSSSVSAAPTATTNGTITTVPPAQTSIVVGAGSALQVGGAIMVGALLAAIAL